ncbi:MAG: hypothetical protein IPK73_30660 [Candidatus Obscuribacter sp.]|nr:hypothetical protein [Candidatus Obscuribacter sp.]
MKHLEQFLTQNADEIPPETRATIRHHIGHGNNSRAASLLPDHLHAQFRAALEADYREKVKGKAFETLNFTRNTAAQSHL